MSGLIIIRDHNPQIRPCEAVFQNSAAQIAANDLFDVGTNKTVLPFKPVVIDQCEYNDGLSIYSYQILEDHDQEQLIEVIETYKDGDNKNWSRFYATEKDVNPVSSRMFYFGFMLSTLPFAFITYTCIEVNANFLKNVTSCVT